MIAMNLNQARRNCVSDTKSGTFLAYEFSEACLIFREHIFCIVNQEKETNLVQFFVLSRTRNDPLRLATTNIHSKQSKIIHNPPQRPKAIQKKSTTTHTNLKQSITAHQVIASNPKGFLTTRNFQQ